MREQMISEERAKELVSRAVNDTIAKCRNNEITEAEMTEILADIMDCQRALDAQREAML